jgi:hypothetical protein
MQNAENKRPMTFLRIKRKIIRVFFREQWSLLVCDTKGAVITPIVPPKDRQWADPFPVEHEGRCYIFIEQQIGHNNGTLGFIELYPDLSYSAFIPILEKPYHLSFPNVFALERDGKKVWYMIPETHENRTVDLYRATAFPHKWEFDMTLMDNVEAVDTVVFQHDSVWWLFTSAGSKANPVNQNLSAFYSERFPSDSWTAHPQNPLCARLNNSRMAGAVVRDAQTGNLVRPAQNCLKDYGKETNLNEIIALSPLRYQERITKTISPEANLHAVCTHTINHSEHFIVRDIKTRRSRLIPA